MQKSLLVAMVGLFLVTGCQSLPEVPGEFQADAELSSTMPPLTPPKAGPGSARPGFDQETLQAQNP